MLERSIAAVVAALTMASCQPAHASPWLEEREAKCQQAFVLAVPIVGEKRAVAGYERCVLQGA